jgi:hypothetical protein
LAILASILAAIASVFGAPTQAKAEDTPNAALYYRRAIAALPKLDQNEQRLLDDYTTDPLNEKSRKLLEKSAAVLREAKAGANIKYCDWGKWSEKELEFDQDRFMPTSHVGRLLCLEARSLFAQRKIKLALEELTLILKLVSDSGRSGPWMARIVQGFVENRVIYVLEQQLPALDHEGLNAVELWLRSLPDRGELTEATKGEKAFMQFSIAKLAIQTDQQALDELKKDVLAPNPIEQAEAIWRAAGGNVAGLVKLHQQSVELLADLDKILLLPSDKAASAFDQFRNHYKMINPGVCAIANALERVRWAEDRVLCRFTLIRAANAIRLRGRDALGDLKDPYGRPVIYEAKNGGFELRTETNRDGEPLATLTVGGGR